jgi:pimeloyl-ACP methyl ester carboxylesterase
MLDSLMRIWLLLALSSCLVPELSLANDKFLDSNGVQLRYTDNGKGPAVILVHGYSGNIEKAWVKPGILDNLIESGFRVVAVDCRGHGKSEKPKTLESYGIPMVEDLVRVSDLTKMGKFGQKESQG